MLWILGILALQCYIFFLCGLIGLLWHSRESVQCLSMRELAIKWAMSDFAEKMAIVLLINRRGFKTIFHERMGVAGKNLWVSREQSPC